MKKSWKHTLVLLSISQSFSQSISIFILTLSAVMGALISGNDKLATVPIAAIFSGTLIGIFPLAHVMARFGRRTGFRLGIILGMSGTLISIAGLIMGSFWIFSLGHVFIGMQQGGFQFLRFAASEIVPNEQRSRGISLVLAGGIVAAFLGPWLAHFSRTYWMADTIAFAYIPLLFFYILLLILFFIVPRMESKPDVNDKIKPISAPRPLRNIVFQLSFLQALFGSAIGFSLMVLLMSATPLAMGRSGFNSSDTSMVIQWHVLGMYIPSFFTGSLIKSLGHRRVIFFGILAILLDICIVFISQGFISFIFALALLGVGWNFLYIASTSRLTECYRSSEKEKAQATHDIIVFSFSTLATFLAAPLLNNIGWVNLHLCSLVILILTAVFILYKFKKEYIVVHPRI